MTNPLDDKEKYRMVKAATIITIILILILLGGLVFALLFWVWSGLL